MDLNELKQKLDSISSELKSKVPKEAQILVESQTVLLEILLSQNERLNETLKTCRKPSRSYVANWGKTLRTVLNLLQPMDIRNPGVYVRAPI